MKKIFLIIDESGAKGYSDKREAYIGEVGIMAGYLVPEQYIDCVKIELENIRKKYSSLGKVHITDLDDNKKKENLREDIFKFFIKKNIICVYEAIHSEGYYDCNQMGKDTIKINRDKNELLHKELFQGVVGKAIAMCLDNIGEQFELAIITDKVDDSIKNKFNLAVDEYIKIGEKKVLQTTSYDPISKKILKGLITSEIPNIKNILGDFSQIKYSICCEDSGLTLAADVIANSINYYFKSRKNESLFKELHTKETMKDFPLVNIIYGLCDSNGTNDFSDAMFKHPKNTLEKEP